jgi:hypothetical protein
VVNGGDFYDPARPEKNKGKKIRMRVEFEPDPLKGTLGAFLS